MVTSMKMKMPSTVTILYTHPYAFFSSFLQENDSDTFIILFSFYSYIRNEDIYSDEHANIQKNASERRGKKEANVEIIITILSKEIKQFKKHTERLIIESFSFRQNIGLIYVLAGADLFERSRVNVVMPRRVVLSANCSIPLAHARHSIDTV